MKYNVYIEGHSKGAKAMSLGRVKGNTFENACQKLAREQLNPAYYNATNNTFADCKLFPSLESAQRKFG